MHCRPTKVLPAVVCPTKCCVNHTYSKTVVPVIHPTHTTNVNHMHTEYQHHYPHTQSVVNEVTSSSVNFPPTFVPGPLPAPAPGVLPGQAVGPMGGPGPMMAPGYGPRPQMPFFGR